MRADGVPGLAASAITVSLLVILALPVDVFPESLPVALLVASLGFLLNRELRGGSVSLVALGAWALLSPTWSVAPGLSLESLLPAALAGALLLLARGTGPSPAVVYGIAAVACFHGGCALWQTVVGLPQLAAAVAGETHPMSTVLLARATSGRAYSTFALPSQLGAAMAALLPVFAIELSARAAGWRRIAPALGLAGALVAIVCSRALGAVLALLLVAGAAVLLVPTRKRSAWFLLALAVVLTGVVGFERGRDVLSSSPQVNPVRARVRHVARAVEVVASAPITGLGVGSYPVASLAYAREGDVTTRHAHASYVEVAAELGLTGLGLLLFLFWEVLRGEGDLRFRLAGCVLLVHATWDFDLQSGLLPIAFAWVGLGGRASGRPWGTVARVSIAVVVVGVSLVAWQRQVGREARSVSSERPPGAERIADLERSLAAWPFDSRAHGLLVTELLQAGRLDQALTIALAARRLEPRTPWVAALEGEVRLARGEGLQAYVAYRDAERGMPSGAEYRDRRQAIGRRLSATGASPP